MSRLPARCRARSVRTTSVTRPARARGFAARHTAFRVRARCFASVTPGLSISYELWSCEQSLSRHSSYWTAEGPNALGREVAREGAAAAERALDLERRAVALQHVPDDRQAEARAAGGARAPGVDAIEALGEPGNVLGRNAHTGVADGEVAAVVVHPPAHLERALGRGVLRGVVDEVRERRVDLRLVADQLRVGLDLHPDIARVHRPGHGVLAQQREQRRHVDRLPAERLSGLLEPRELEEVPDDARHALGLAAHLRDRRLKIRVERGIVAESLEIARDHGERGAQLVRGVGDEVAPYRLEPHLARHVAYQQQQLPVSVR